MQIAYIAPSVMPSRSANSIHVARMVEALTRAGHEVTLFFKRSVDRHLGLRTALEDYYGVELGRTRTVSVFNRWGLADNLLIALRAAAWLLRNDGAELIVSRNLYASFIFTYCWNRRIVFETHQLETGFRKRMQSAAMRSPGTLTVVISQALLKILSGHHGYSPSAAVVLPDAAPSGLGPLTETSREQVRTQTASALGKSRLGWCAGYFGQLYQGRGVDILIGLAERHPAVSFLVYGGSEHEARKFQPAHRLSNLHFMGHVAPRETARLMAAMDCLLMPYQEKVSIGVRGHDTARWMSPMKMFEYMASGTPIIASDLPALREILRDRENALLAAPRDLDAWSNSLRQLIENPALAQAIGRNAHREYAAEYTWDRRASRMISAVSSACPNPSSS
jgi:glycosyltransferase involved in cell wall biosynthesis